MRDHGRRHHHAVGFWLGVVNAQAIAKGIQNLAPTLIAAGKAMIGLGTASKFAAGGMRTLKAAARGAAVATGIGIFGAAAGFAAEKLFDFLDSGDAVANQTEEFGGKIDGFAKEWQKSFGGALGGVAASGDAAAGALQEATKELEAEEKAVQDILNRLQGQSNLAVDVAIEFGEEGFAAGVAFQQALRDIARQVESEILNATSADMAAEDAKKAFDKTIAGLKERQQLQQQLAEQERAIDEERLRTLSRADTGPLKFDDIRTSSGASQLAAFNREDPAIAEAVKQTAELRKIREKITALEAPPVDIVGN